MGFKNLNIPVCVAEIGYGARWFYISIMSG